MLPGKCLIKVYHERQPTPLRAPDSMAEWSAEQSIVADIVGGIKINYVSIASF